MALWIAGAERIPSGKSGATYREPNSPWRFVFHTMEAPDKATSGLWSTVAGLKSYIAGHAAPPHLWCWPERDWVGQCIPLDLSAYALRHPAGTPETNHKHAIQVEILGYARDAPCIEHAAWLGRRIIKPVIAAGIPLNLNHLAPSGEAGTAGVNGAVRFTDAQWAAFDGLCGHQNVPDNDHWDPGRADYAAIARAARGVQGFLMALTDAQQKQVYNWLAAMNKRIFEIGVSVVPQHQGSIPPDTRFQVQTLFKDLLGQPRLEMIAGSAVQKSADVIADAVVAALPPASGGGVVVDPEVVKAAVKAALREGTE